MTTEQTLTAILDDSLRGMGRIVTNPPGSTPASKTFRRARAASLAVGIERLRESATRQASTLLATALPAAYRTGIADGIKQARAAGVRPSGEMARGDFAAIDREAVMVVVRSSVEDVSRALASAAERARSVLRQTAEIGLSNRDINTIIARGVIAGTPLDAARELREQLRAIHGDTLPVIDRNGDTINFEVGKYATMVVRTRTREATVKGRHNRLEGLGLDLVRIVGRVSNSFCTAFLFRVYSLSGNHPKYPPYSSLPDGPPFHPNCSKSTAPYVEALASPAQAAIAEPGGDTDKLLGQKDTTKLQRMYGDLQLRAQVEVRYKAAQRAAKGAA